MERLTREKSSAKAVGGRWPWTWGKYDLGGMMLRGFEFRKAIPRMEWSARVRRTEQKRNCFGEDSEDVSLKHGLIRGQESARRWWWWRVHVSNIRGSQLRLYYITDYRVIFFV